jgi:transcriptional regulator with XRE-family HTH domain
MQESEEKKLKISDDSEAFRIMLLIDALKTNERQFAISLGMSQERINNITNGRNGAGYQVIKKIIEIYRTLNPRWLLFGEGEMFITQPQINVVQEERAEYKTKVDERLDRIEDFLKKKHEDF